MSPPAVGRRRPAPSRRTTSTATPRAGDRGVIRRRPPRELLTGLRVQADNAQRHVAALRPFTRAEFGTGPEAPTEGHVRSTNELLAMLRDDLQGRVRTLERTVQSATNVPSQSNLRRLVSDKERAHGSA